MPAVGHKDACHDHPELTTQVTQTLKIGPYRVWREAGGLRVDDGAGAVGDFSSIVSAAAVRRVLYLRGTYKKPGPVAPIHGRAVAILEYAALPAAERLGRRVGGDVAKTARAIDADPAHVHDELRRRPDVRPAELEELRRLLDLP